MTRGAGGAWCACVTTYPQRSILPGRGAVARCAGGGSSAEDSV